MSFPFVSCIKYFLCVFLLLLLLALVEGSVVHIIPPYVTGEELEMGENYLLALYISVPLVLFPPCVTGEEP